MYHQRRAVAVTFSAAMLAATISACGGSAQPATSSPPASSDPLAGLTADQITTKAMTNTEKAPFVQVKGSTTDSGQPLTFDLSTVSGKGCTGTMREGKKGSFQLVVKGATVWVKPDRQFYQSSGAPASVVTVLDGKYLKDKPGAGLGSVASMCVVKNLLGNPSGGQPAGLVKGATAVIDGQRAVKVSDTGDSAYLYISDTAEPEVVRLTDPSSGGGTFDFGYADTGATITPPPASEVLDGAKYGF